MLEDMDNFMLSIGTDGSRNISGNMVAFPVWSVLTVVTRSSCHGRGHVYPNRVAFETYSAQLSLVFVVPSTGLT